MASWPGCSDARCVLAAGAARRIRRCGDNRPPRRRSSTCAGAAGRPRRRPSCTTATAGYHYYRPPLHPAGRPRRPDGPTFLQEVSLLHRDVDGADDRPHLGLLGLLPRLRRRADPAARREPDLDRAPLLRQLAARSGGLVEAHDRADGRRRARDRRRRCSTIYTGAFISTGGCKGGMTAVFYRRFFPDDVDGTVPYVAPISFGAPDVRYPAFLASVGHEPTATSAVEDVAIEMLAQPPRGARGARPQAQADDEGLHVHARRDRPGGRVARSSASSGRSGSTTASTSARRVPAVTASDDDLFAFLDTVSPPSDSDDEQVALFEAYYYQAYYQLGYPDDGTTTTSTPYEHVQRRRLRRLAADRRRRPTTAAPRCTTSTTSSRTQGDRLLFVYGQWDPWTGGAFDARRRDRLARAGPGRRARTARRSAQLADRRPAGRVREARGVDRRHADPPKIAFRPREPAADPRAACPAGDPARLRCARPSH